MTTTVLHGDCLELMKRAQRNRFDCQFVYMDPPFFTQKVHKMADGQVAFEDKWESLEQYVEYLRERVGEAWRLLTPNGCMIVHVDPKTSHYVKVMLDGVFGRDCFASEIIWRYRRWPSKTRNLQRVHDVLLRYLKVPADKPTFNQLYEPLAPSTRAAWGTRKQRAVVQGGRRVRTSLTDEQSPGVPLGDVWDDIGIIAPVAKERTGYPTQKPEELLERLLLAFTNPGDMVLDPYCGSGTTLAVARRLGRSAVGIDSSQVAVETTEDRIAQQVVA